MTERWTHHAGGILFDGACLALGFAAPFMAFWAWYEGDGVSNALYWFFRLALATLPLVLIALASTRLRHDVPWRCWLRFALFECLSLLLLAYMLQHQWSRNGSGDAEASLLFLLPLLIDSAVYALAVNAWRLRRHQVRPA
ncbi:hypothetical protein ACLESO_18360 [Pyxidicoccus sp. 3LG]